MLEHEILWEEAGILWLGREGESTYGRRNFLELFSVFTSPPLFSVLHGRQELGYVDELTFLQKQDGPRFCCWVVEPGKSTTWTGTAAWRTSRLPRPQAAPAGKALAVGFPTACARRSNRSSPAATTATGGPSGHRLAWGRSGPSLLGWMWVPRSS